MHSHASWLQLSWLKNLFGRGGGGGDTDSGWV
jgi:hypothetical protein